MNIRYLSSSIGKKQIVAVTGLMLIGFVVAHLLGNLTLFGGPDAFNGYAEKLASLGPLLYVMRVLLGSVFIVHMVFTAMLVIQNRKARPEKYDVSPQKGKRSIAARLMPVSGTILLVFLIVHLLDFSLNSENPDGTATYITYGAEVLKLKLYGLVYNYFQNPIRIVGYLGALSFLCLHMAHAFQSACQTFGVHSDSISPLLKKASLALGVILLVGFGSIPLYLKFGNPLGS